MNILCKNCGHPMKSRIYRGRFTWMHVSEKHGDKDGEYICGYEPKCKCMAPEPR